MASHRSFGEDICAETTKRVDKGQYFTKQTGADTS